MNIIEKATQIAEKYSSDHEPDIKSACLEMAHYVLNNIWKSADGNDLPEIDREVIALENHTHKVMYAHRPNPNGWNGKSITTGKVEHYTPKTYDSGGWNVPNVSVWLDLALPFS